MTALRETRFAEAREIKEVGAVFWSIRKSEERRETGVGFASKSDLAGELAAGLPKSTNDHLITYEFLNQAINMSPSSVLVHLQ